MDPTVVSYRGLSLNNGTLKGYFNSDAPGMPNATPIEVQRPNRLILWQNPNTESLVREPYIVEFGIIAYRVSLL